MATLTRQIELTQRECDDIYYERKIYYYALDAEKHCNHYIAQNHIHLVEPLKDEDYRNLARIFDTRHDCNETDNAQWESLVAFFFKTKPHTIAQQEIPSIGLAQTIKDYLLKPNTRVLHVMEFLHSNYTKDIYTDTKLFQQLIDNQLELMSDDDLSAFYNTYICK